MLERSGHLQSIVRVSCRGAIACDSVNRDADADCCGVLLLKGQEDHMRTVIPHRENRASPELVAVRTSRWVRHYGLTEDCELTELRLLTCMGSEWGRGLSLVVGH